MYVIRIDRADFTGSARQHDLDHHWVGIAYLPEACTIHVVRAVFTEQLFYAQRGDGGGACRSL